MIGLNIYFSDKKEAVEACICCLNVIRCDNVVDWGDSFVLLGRTCIVQLTVHLSNSRASDLCLVLDYTCTL